MSDGSLSQDEIDALLQGGDMNMGGSSRAAGGSDELGKKEIAKFTEIIKELVPLQAQNLSNMVGDSVEMTSPVVELVSRDQLISGLEDEIVEINMDFQDQISGKHYYIIGPESATTIAGLMMGQDQVDLNEAALSAIEEAANTLAGAASTLIGDRSGKLIMTAPGETRSIPSSQTSVPEGSVVKVSYKTKIDGKEPTEFVEVFSVPLVRDIVGEEEIPVMESAGGAAGMNMGGFGGAPSMNNMNMAPQGQMMGMGAPAGGMFGMGPSQANVQSVQFPNLNPQASGYEQGNIGLLMDVYMEMTVELGRTKKLIKEILGMGEGTIIELDKLAGEPVDILVNHKLIAKGEVVVIDENFGVRVTEIVSPIDRVDGL